MLRATETTNAFEAGVPYKNSTMIKAYTKRLISESGEKDKGNDPVMEHLFLKYARYPFIIAKIIKTKNLYGMTGKKFDPVAFKRKIDRFAEANAPNFFWNENYQAALEKVRHDLARYVRDNGLLKPLRFTSEQMVVQSLTTTSTSAGWLSFMTGKRKKADNVREALSEYNKKMAALALSDYSPIVFATRTKCVNTILQDLVVNPDWDCTTRVIHMVSFEDILIEMFVGKALMTMFCGLGWYAGGMDDETLTTEVLRLRRSKKYWISIDYSSYDMTISDWLIKDAFNLLFECFEPGTVSEEYKEFIIRGFTFTRYLDVDGLVKRKNKGVPSGSYFTQIIDTTVNRIMIECYAIKENLIVSMIIMGDDNLIFCNTQINKETLASYLFKNFQIKANDDKTEEGDDRIDPSFLHRNWTPHGATRNLGEIVIQFTTPERFRKYVDKDLPEEQRLASDLIRPEEVFLSAIMSYRITMRQHFDIDRFYLDYPRLAKTKMFTTDMLKSASGSLKYRLLYAERGRNVVEISTRRARSLRKYQSRDSAHWENTVS